MIGEQRGDAETSPATIVVGVDGSAASSAAVHYAVELAAGTGATVRLLHAVPDYSAIQRLSLVLGDTVYETGRHLLFDITSRAQFAAPGVRVESELTVGSRTVQLVRAAQRAQLLILGRRSRGHEPYLFGAGTAAAVAAGTTCPVRVVPTEWRKHVKRTEVVVGLKDVETSFDLLRRGFLLARESGGTLAVVHGWDLPFGYDAVVSERDLETWSADLAAHVAAHVAIARQGFDDVAFRVQVSRGRPADALLNEAEGAALLLVGRHSHRHPLGYLGGVPRALLQASSVPVEIGPASHETNLPLDLVLEQSGELLR